MIKYYIRYADDFVVLSGNEAYLRGMITAFNEFSANNLKLRLHHRKIIVRKWHQGIDFLGYVNFPHHSILRPKTRRRMMKKINLRNAQSYFGILKHCRGYGIMRSIRDRVDINDFSI